MVNFTGSEYGDPFIDFIKQCKPISDELFELYENLNIIISANQKEHNYIYIGSGMGKENGKSWFDIQIMVDGKKNGLPEYLGNLFFDKIDLNYKVKVDGGVTFEGQKMFNILISEE